MHSCVHCRRKPTDHIITERIAAFSKPQERWYASSFKGATHSTNIITSTQRTGRERVWNGVWALKTPAKCSHDTVVFLDQWGLFSELFHVISCCIECVCEYLKGGISILTLPPAVAPQLKPCTSLNLWPAPTLSPNESSFNFLCSYHNKNAGFVWTVPQLFCLTSKFEYSSLPSVTRHLAHFQHHAQHLTLSPVLLEFHQLVPNRQEHRLT